MMLRALCLFLAFAPGAALAQNPAPAIRASAWEALDSSLSDTNADHRQEALAALATFSTPDAEAVARVEKLLTDKVPLLRQSAALALGQMKATHAIPALRSALDDSPEIAFAAAKALTAMGDSGGREVLIAVLAGERKDAPGMMTTAVRTAKDKLHHPEGLLLMGAQDATGAMFGPVSMVIPVIKDAADMKGRGGPGRAAAAAWIAKDSDPHSVTLLEWALNDESQLVRVEAAKGLGERGNGESIAKLQALLSDPQNFVRDMCAVSILRVSSRHGAAGEVTSMQVTPAAMEKH